MAEQKKSPSLFRKEALDHAASPDSLNQLIRVTTPRAWLILLCLIGLIMATFVWSFLGSIPTRVNGDGILLSAGGNIYNAMSGEGTCYVQQLEVEVGEFVRKGDVVARLDCPDLASRVENIKEYLTELQKEHAELTQQSETEIAQRRQQLAEQNAILRGIIEVEQSNLNEISELLEIRRSSFEKGLITRQEVLASLSDFNNSKQEIERTKEQITQNKYAESSFIDQWSERSRNLELQIDEQSHNLNNLQDNFEISQGVRSPANGVVTMIQKNVGDLINTPGPIVSIASMNEGLDAVVYVPAEQGKRVKVGAKALVSPTNIKREEYGSMIGEVISVSQYPTTSFGMMAILQNQDLVEEFAKKGALIAVRIRLNLDENTFSGVEWSSSTGPEQQITPGSLVATQLTVREQAPISLVIPAFKKLLGA